MAWGGKLDEPLHAGRGPIFGREQTFGLDEAAASLVSAPGLAGLNREGSVDVIRAAHRDFETAEESVVAEPLGGAAAGERLEEHRVEEDALSAILAGERLIVVEGVVVARTGDGLSGAAEG
jgi:hypothetical protein